MARERGIAVDQNRRGLATSCDGIGLRVIGLQRARAPFDDRIDRFEVARVVCSVTMICLPLVVVVHAGRAVVILHVAGHVVVAADVAALMRRFEFAEQFFVGHVDDVRDHAQAPAMRHAEHRVGRILVGQHLEHLLEHRHHHVEAFAREGLLAEERLANEALEGFDLGQALQEANLPVRAKAQILCAPLSIVSRSQRRCSVFEMCSNSYAIVEL